MDRAALSLTPSLYLAPSHTHILSFSLTLTLTLTLSLSRAHTHTLTLALTLNQARRDALRLVEKLVISVQGEGGDKENANDLQRAPSTGSSLHPAP